MLRMLSPSTGSESLRPRHVFLPCESDAKNDGCDIFHLCTSVICHSVNIARVHSSAGPLSLKQNGVFPYHTTSCCTDQYAAHSTHKPHLVEGGVHRKSNVDKVAVGGGVTRMTVAGSGHGSSAMEGDFLH